MKVEAEAENCRRGRKLGLELSSGVVIKRSYISPDAKDIAPFLVVLMKEL